MPTATCPLAVRGRRGKLPPVDVDLTMVEEALPEDRVLKENAIAELVNALS